MLCASLNSRARCSTRARARAAKSGTEFNSVYDGYILHALPACIVRDGHAAGLGRED